MTDAQTLEIAVRIAQEAGALVRQRFGQQHEVTFKGAVDPVTEADQAAETLILTRLRAHFPHHAFHAEEGGGAAWQTGAPTWLIDPLDGTNNFAHNFPHVGISLGLVIAGEPVVGVIHDPLREETFAARRGAGATCNGQPLHVTSTATLAEAFLATGLPYERRVLADNNTRRLDHFARRCQGIRRAGAAALDLAYVACGRFDGYWEPLLKPWDVAAGILLVREAGGQVTDFTGGPEVLSGRELVASNGHIHAAMLRVIREGAAAPHPDWPALGGD